MATATFSTRGRERAVETIKEEVLYIEMSTVQPSGALTKDTEMMRDLTWGSPTHYAQTNNVIPIKTSDANSEFQSGLIFPLAPNRRFSNLTLRMSNYGVGEYPILLTFNLDGANSSIVPSFGAIMFVGQITFTFGGV